MQSNRRDRRRRSGRGLRLGPIIGFLVAAYIVSQFLSWSNILIWLFFGAIIMFTIRQLSQSGNGSQSGQFGQERIFTNNSPAHRLKNDELNRIKSVADKALQQAGRIPGESPLELDDIGLLVYENSTQPQIFRTADVTSTSSHIRPFIVLDQPDIPNLSGHGIIRFNLVDGQGKLRYTNRSRYNLKPGPNFITPPTWLPTQQHDALDLSSDWTMQVVIGESTVFAVHKFGWLKVGGQERARFNGDGEIDEVARFYEYQRPEPEPMSLDELLADQAEEVPLTMNVQK
jgi:hypothetical protein